MRVANWKASAGLRWVTTGLLTVLLLAPTVGFACEACKESVKDDPVGAALSATTLLLIAMPMLLIGSIGGWVGYAYWRADRRAVAADASSAQSSEIVSHPV